jgi:hypothetical protein
LARVAGIVAGLEPDLEVVNSAAIDSNGKIALTVDKETLPGNV